MTTASETTVTTRNADFEPGVYVFAGGRFLCQCDDLDEYIERTVKFGPAQPYYRKSNGRLFRWSDGRR